MKTFPYVTYYNLNASEYEKKKIERKLFVPYEYWEADMKPQSTCACLHFPYTMALRNASSRQAAAAEHQQCIHWVHINPSAFKLVQE